MTEAPLFETLKANVGGLWERAQDHPFVHGIADGSLPEPKFIVYLLQDYAYLSGFSRAIALASAKAPTLQRMGEFAALLNETLTVEMQLHRDYCAEFGITPEQLAATEASPVCRAYVDFGVATAALGDVLDLLSALAPCGVGYAQIGARLRGRLAGAPEHPYRRWIETYGGEEYQRYARWMIEAMNEMGTGLPPARVEQLTTLFRLGCRYEWLFWEMALGEQTWPI